MQMMGGHGMSGGMQKSSQGMMGMGMAKGGMGMMGGNMGGGFGGMGKMGGGMGMGGMGGMGGGGMGGGMGGPPRPNHGGRWQNGQVVGEYTLGPEICEGSYGVVRQAVKAGGQQQRGQQRGQQQQQVFAIKIVPTPRYCDTEVNIQQRMQHDNIVKVVDTFSQNNYTFLVLEYCKGGDMFEWVQRNQARMNEQKARGLFRQMLAPIMLLHSSGVIHHDVKLENYLMTNEGKVKLCDFGAAEDSPTPAGLTDRFKGDASAPEKVQGRMFNGYHSDVYQLGKTLHELVFMMRPPHESGGYNPAPGMRVSSQLQDLLQTTLNPDPNARPTVQQLAQHPWVTAEGPMPAVAPAAAAAAPAVAQKAPQPQKRAAKPQTQQQQQQQGAHQQKAPKVHQAKAQPSRPPQPEKLAYSLPIPPPPASSAPVAPAPPAPAQPQPQRAAPQAPTPPPAAPVAAAAPAAEPVVPSSSPAAAVPVPAQLPSQQQQPTQPTAAAPQLEQEVGGGSTAKISAQEASAPAVAAAAKEGSGVAKEGKRRPSGWGTKPAEEAHSALEGWQVVPVLAPIETKSGEPTSCPPAISNNEAIQGRAGQVQESQQADSRPSTPVEKPQGGRSSPCPEPPVQPPSLSKPSGLSLPQPQAAPMPAPTQALPKKAVYSRSQSQPTLRISGSSHHHQPQQQQQQQPHPHHHRLQAAPAAPVGSGGASSGLRLASASGQMKGQVALMSHAQPSSQGHRHQQLLTAGASTSASMGHKVGHSARSSRRSKMPSSHRHQSFSSRPTTTLTTQQPNYTSFSFV